MASADKAQLKEPQQFELLESMKLILQIAAGVTLGWITIAAIKGALALSAVAALANTIGPNNGPFKIPAPAAASATPKVYTAPPVNAPMTKQNVDQYINDDFARARNDHDNAFGPAPATPNYTVRKATAADAAAKPAQ